MRLYIHALELQKTPGERENAWGFLLTDTDQYRNSKGVTVNQRE
jgi:hypothetical protein